MFSGKTANYQDRVIKNVEFWPDINAGEFEERRQIPASIANATVVAALLAAIDSVNRDLDTWADIQCGKGYSTAADVPGPSCDGVNALTESYKKAVFARAKADLMPEFATVGRRETHPGAESQETADGLRGEAAQVIRQIMGYARATVRLL
ncbi:head completion/stabilization protein [Salmonella enterica subsp. enterica]|nr:head completion/stabilization protein [Salmonella enterica]EDP8616239.1 head completion/stabilization protein [Salmonella enterica subsp. enterica]EKY7088821.1 head completion/stabilization protein [Salmonella enterica]